MDLSIKLTHNKEANTKENARQTKGTKQKKPTEDLLSNSQGQPVENRKLATPKPFCNPKERKVFHHEADLAKTLEINLGKCFLVLFLIPKECKQSLDQMLIANEAQRTTGRER